jgi:hypothetical protein
VPRPDRPGIRPRRRAKRRVRGMVPWHIYTQMQVQHVIFSVVRGTARGSGFPSVGNVLHDDRQRSRWSLIRLPRTIVPIWRSNEADASMRDGNGRIRRIDGVL